MLDFQIIDALVEQAAKPSQLASEGWIIDAYQRVYDRVGDRVNYYKFLRSCVKLGGFQVILELGVEFGIASAMMAAAHNGIVIGIDLNHHDIPASIGNVCPNYHYVLGDATSDIVFGGVKSIVEKHGQIGMVFQDSSHHYTASHREFQLYGSLCAPGALWVCDDITPAFHDSKVDPPGKGMVEYFHELPGQKKLYKDVLHYGNTMGVVIL